MSKYNQMLYMNLSSAIVATSILLATGRFPYCASFVAVHSGFAGHVLTLSLSAAAGQFYIFSMVQRFGALALAAAMNARQVTTIFLSYLTQTQPLTWVQRVGLIILFVFFQNHEKELNGSDPPRNDLENDVPDGNAEDETNPLVGGKAKLYSHKFYRRAAKDAVKIYLELYDAKVSGCDDQAGSADGASKEGGENELSAEEKKKMKHKKKREAQKQEQKATTPATTATGKPKKVDDDPEGEKLLQQDFMEQACKIVRTMVTFSALDSATHVMTYEVFSRQKKSLHCLQALRQLWELGGRDSLYYKLLAPLAHFCFVLGDEGAVPFKSAAEMKEAASKLVDAVEQKIKTTNDLFLVEVLYGLKCLKAAGRDRLAVLEAWQPQGAMSLKESRKLLAYLEKEFGKDSAPWAKLQRRCLEFFPLMVIA
eukprot:g10936.t1